MRYSSLSSFPSELNDDDFTFHALSSSESPDSLSLCDSKVLDTQLLPLQPKNWMIGHGDEWMQPVGLDFQFEGPDDHFSSAPPPPPPHSDPSQLYGESAFTNPFYANFPQQASQQSGGSHRRLPSSSSVASAAESPFSNNSSLPLQPYPTTYPHLSGFPAPQPSAWGYDSSSPISGVQQIPTPIGTPTSDKYPQAGLSHPRRTRHTPGQQAALAAAHNSVRLALNEQWRPRTYTPSNLQTQNSNFADMPRTPVTVNGDEPDAQQYGPVPRFNRTVSDAKADELYNPSTYGQPSNMALRPQPQNSAFLQPQQSMLQERLTAANEARSSSPSSLSGHASPFRRSPYNPDSSSYNQQSVPGPMPNNDLAQSGASNYPRQMRQKRDTDEPKTVSPKDAFPEQPVSKEESYSTLFPTETTQPLQYAPHNAQISDMSSFTSLPPTFNFGATSIPTSGHMLDIKQETTPQEQRYAPFYAPNTNHGSYMPPNLTSMETTKSEESEQSEESPEIKVERPTDTSASSSRYTCPYKDEATGWKCNERFDDPMQLNRHKKEDHRSSGGQADKKPAKMSQAGPHKCNRINPSTGKPCDTVFSRPYDLTRHEDTIHGERKKTKCPYCTEEKLFSRGDALTRHLRVVHASMPQHLGKQRGRRVT